MASPIFVIGRNRSGTKWLSNIIANHPDVAAVQHQEHFGILEATDIFLHMPMIFGDLSIPENYIGFLECLSQTDFFRLTGLDKGYFYAFRQPDYFTFFREMMDKYAAKSGKKYWVQKSGVMSLGTLHKHYDDAKFIIIVRDMVENIKSTIALGRLLEEEQHKKSLFRLQVKYFTDMAQIKRFATESNVSVIRYEDLIKDRNSVLSKMCTFLGMSFDETMEKDYFRNNSSFGGAVGNKHPPNKDEILTKSDVLKMKMYSAFLSALPRQIYDWLDLLHKKNFYKTFFHPQQRRFLSFRLRRNELGW